MHYLYSSSTIISSQSGNNLVQDQLEVILGPVQERDPWNGQDLGVVPFVHGPDAVLEVARRIWRLVLPQAPAARTLGAAQREEEPQIAQLRQLCVVVEEEPVQQKHTLPAYGDAQAALAVVIVCVQLLYSCSSCDAAATAAVQQTCHVLPHLLHVYCCDHVPVVVRQAPRRRHVARVVLCPEVVVLVDERQGHLQPLLQRLRQLPRQGALAAVGHPRQTHHQPVVHRGD